MKSDQAATSYDTSYDGGPTASPLYLHRHLRRWTQSELGARSGLTQEAVSLIERGLQRPRPATKARLAAALSVPVKGLFPERDE